MEYLNKFKSTVSSAAAQVSQATRYLPGNPLLREYELHDQPFSVWLFERKQIEKWPKAEKEAFPELIKRGVSQLTRLRHPRLLTVEHALEESRDNFAFATEEVFTSLANVFGETENLDKRPKYLENFKFEEIEIRHGLFQLSEALTFLHNDAKLLHSNVSSQAVLINTKGAWKLSGFEFCVAGIVDATTNQITYAVAEWDRTLMDVMLPAAAAPEQQSGAKCDPHADVFSLGMLACTIFNNYKPVNRRGVFESQGETEIPVDWLKNVPPVFVPDLKQCLQQSPDLRPDASQLTRIAYFDDPALKTLNYLESLMQMDPTQKMQFFKGLPQVLNRFPNRPLLQKIFPCLSGGFDNLELIPFMLPSVFYIAENVEKEEFATKIFPSIAPLFRIQRPYQIILMLLQKMPLLLEKTPNAEIKEHVLPLVYNAICNENPRIQELCLQIVPTVGKLVDRDAMKTQLLPKLLKLAIEGSVLSIRVMTLLCLGKLLPTLEPWMVHEQVLPAMPRINSREPSILMAVLGIYKLAHENEKFGIGRGKHPFTFTCVENTLNVNQFEQYMSMIRALMHKVETEQRSRLNQLSAGQEGQQNTPDFNEIFSQASTSSDIADLHNTFGGLSTSSGGAGANFGTNGSVNVSDQSDRHLAASTAETGDRFHQLVVAYYATLRLVQSIRSPR
ncbi:Protein kinase domain-containing protein [Aphelenchoides fujianensis]|nr:Protein kinase domain-containing protein [Aphelenchoides fujianensis]